MSMLLMYSMHTSDGWRTFEHVVAISETKIMALLVANAFLGMFISSLNDDFPLLI
jgi:hypothetical protein